MMPLSTDGGISPSRWRQPHVMDIVWIEHRGEMAVGRPTTFMRRLVLRYSAGSVGMKGTHCLLVCLIALVIVSASEGQTTPPQDRGHHQPQSSGERIQLWARTYGGTNIDEMKGHSSLDVTSDGGFVFAGSTWAQAKNQDDLIVMKLDAAGLIEWQRVYGGSEEDKAYGGIHETPDGGFVVVGFTMALDYGTHVIWVLKLTQNGDIEWQKTYGTDYNLDFPYASNLTTDGGYIISGQTYSYGGGPDVWILKLFSDGTIDWQRRFGGYDIDESADVIHQTNDGGYIFAGSTWSYGAGEGDFWVVKLDSFGDIEWQRTYGGEQTEYAHSIQPTIDGGYIVAGRTETFGAGGYDCWIVKLSHHGDIEWQRAYGGIGDWENCAAIIEENDGGYVIGGVTNSFGPGGRNLWVFKLDALGEFLWQHTYGGHANEYSCSVQQTREGGYVFAGFSRSSQLGEGRIDVLILKLSHEGTIGESCGIMGSSYAQITETSVSPSDTDVSLMETSVTPQWTEIVPREFDGDTHLLCQSEWRTPGACRPSRRMGPPPP